jgi:hypothetical protein
MTAILRSAAALAAFAACVYAQKPVLTEDFESGKIDPAIWDTRAKGAPTIGVEQVEGAHGKYALHIHYPDMERNAYAFIVATKVPDSVRTHFFGRAYMKITPSIGQSHNPLIFAGGEGWPISRFLEIGAYKGNWMPSYQENKLAAGQGRSEVTYRSDVAPPFDKWFLLEWEFNDNPDSITMWVDGEKLTQTMKGEHVETVTFPWKSPLEPTAEPKSSNLVEGFKEWGFGVREWQNPTPAIDVYYDDIAISPTRIGPVK